MHTIGTDTSKLVPRLVRKPGIREARVRVERVGGSVFDDVDFAFDVVGVRVDGEEGGRVDGEELGDGGWGWGRDERGV